MVPSLPLLPCESSVAMKKTLIEKKHIFIDIYLIFFILVWSVICSARIIDDDDEELFLWYS